MLRHLHHELVPRLLGIHTVLGHLHQALQHRRISIAVLLDWRIDAEVVRDVAVGIVVGYPVQGSEILTGLQRCLLPCADASSRHHQRTLHNGCCPTRLIGGAALVDFHLVGSKVQMALVGHHHFDNIFLRPLAKRNLHIATWLIIRGQRLSVQANIEVLRCPVRHAQLHAKAALALGNTDGALLGRPLTLLNQRHTLGIPLGTGGQIECHPNGLVVCEIGSLLILHVILGTRTATASRLRRLVAPGLRGIQPDGILIEHGIFLLVD